MVNHQVIYLLKLLYPDGIIRELKIENMSQFKFKSFKEESYTMDIDEKFVPGWMFNEIFKIFKLKHSTLDKALTELYDAILNQDYLCYHMAHYMIINWNSIKELSLKDYNKLCDSHKEYVYLVCKKFNKQLK